MKSKNKTLFEDLFVNYPTLAQCKKEIEAAFNILVVCYRNRGKVLVCGNGGSASDSEHIVGELMKEFIIKRPVPSEVAEKICATDPQNGEKISMSLQSVLPALSLVSQISLISAFANDVDAEMAFAQQVYGYGQENDVLLALSTSGNSPNVCNAARVAKATGLSVISMTGQKKCVLTQFSDVAICAPSDTTLRIQEYHMPVYHTL
jgi:D-sedoheptulose 7-phosphate isomerase